MFYKLLKIGIDTCPIIDSTIDNGMCLGCAYFTGLKPYQGTPCIICYWFLGYAED